MHSLLDSYTVYLELAEKCVTRLLTEGLQTYSDIVTLCQSVIRVI